VKWIGIGIAVLALLFGGVIVYFSAFANPRIEAELRRAPDGEHARKVMLLALPSGRTLPVNYLREGATLYAGADGSWWRELRGAGAPVELFVRGETLRGHALAIEDDPGRTRDVFDRLRPSVPRWLPDALNGVLVEIQLQGEAPPRAH
jgi:hypothetical protein